MKWKRIDNYKKMPFVSGLYAIYDKRNNELLYIGRAKSLYYRFVKCDKRCGFSPIRYNLGAENLFFKYKVTEDLSLEKDYIKKIRPKYNFMSNPDKKRIKVYYTDTAYVWR